MNADELKDIIQMIPECITYIYPGYLTIFLFLFLRGKSMKEDNYIWIKAIAISYIYISFKPLFKKILLLLSGLFDISKIPEPIKYNLYLMGLSVLVAYLGQQIITADTTKKILKLLDIIQPFMIMNLKCLLILIRGHGCVYILMMKILYMKDR